jgi:hypothetical protein
MVVRAASIASRGEQLHPPVHGHVIDFDAVLALLAGSASTLMRGRGGMLRYLYLDLHSVSSQFWRWSGLPVATFDR